MFKSRVHAKWILAGEHAVLRGYPALVLPVSSCYLDMEYEASDNELTVECDSDQGTQLQLVILGLLEKALMDVGKKRSDVKGCIRIHNRIPLAGGMGASAGLCVVITRLLQYLGFVSEDGTYLFAKSMEDLFHGESSGVDIACVLKNQPLVFKIPDQMEPFEAQWEPHWCLSHSGKRGVTSECVDKVKKLWLEDGDRGKAIDEKMEKSFSLAKSALLKDGDLATLTEAIHLARECFEDWGLVSSEIKQHEGVLQSHGALATKPTGSGDGGFVLSLWEKPPGLKLGDSDVELIPLDIPVSPLSNK